jgi:hypothetical protein
MPASCDMTTESDRIVDHVHVYVDSSHLWMHGQNLFATRHGFLEWDPLWRFDIGRLRAIMEQHSGLHSDNILYSFQYHLHGSVPPVDSIWRDGSRDVHLGKSPDDINAQIITDSVTTAVSASFGQTRNTFVFVSGDSGLFAAVDKIQQCGYPVHIWSWKTGLAAKYGEAPVEVHLLDDYFERLRSYDTAFCVDPAIVSPDSLVVLDPLSGEGKIQDWISRLKTPVYQYTITRQRKTSDQDLVIIPAFQADNWRVDGPRNDLLQAKAQMEDHGFRILSYTEYVRQHVEDSTGQLTISNQFKELPAKLWGVDGEDDGTDNTKDNSGTTWTTVDHSKKKRENQNKKDQKTRKRCAWRAYCNNGVHCHYAHTKEEEDCFVACGSKTARKYRMCRYQDKCYRKTLCLFAHSEQELFCPTCGKTAGHGMENCPERFM